MKNNKKTHSQYIFIAIIVILFLITFILGFLLYNEKSKATPTSVILANETEEQQNIKKFQVTTEYIKKTLEDISELSTAELSYTGICTVEDGTIPFITKKGFSMLYKGSIKAGIDASQINIDITDNEVIIYIPRATLQEPVIKPESIKFYDEKKALFNWKELSDSVDGIVLAQEDIKLQAEIDDLLERADKQAEYIVEGLLKEIVKEAEGERNLRIIRI